MFRFIDREEELATLEGRYRLSDFEFVVLYGRRRVGKTELLKQFIAGKPHLYFMADKRGTIRNVLRLRRDMAKSVSEPEIASTEMDEVFHWYVEKAGKRPLIIIDEFPYLAEKDDAIPSVFQLMVDEMLKESNVMLILCGSSMGMMERTLLGSRSPLYGRKTAHMKIMPLGFNEACRFFPGNGKEGNVEFYGVLGGVPYYLSLFSGRKSTLRNIEEVILSRTGRLYEEVDFLLKEELREPDVYKGILEAIAGGTGKAMEIAQRSRVPIQDLDKYLKVLINLGFVIRTTPITETKAGKKSRYIISDPFFRFWFRFCEPHKSSLEIGHADECLTMIRRDLPAYTGHIFETISTDLISRKFPGRWPRIGRWWGARRMAGKRVEEEIDIVGINEKTGEILFAECKWKARINGEVMLHRLKEKARYVEWQKGRRKETYAIFAKSFKQRPRPSEAMLFDMDQI